MEGRVEYKYLQAGKTIAHIMNTWPIKTLIIYCINMSKMSIVLPTSLNNKPQKQTCNRTRQRRGGMDHQQWSLGWSDILEVLNFAKSNGKDAFAVNSLVT